ncbi:Transposable element P transposase [Eumeta japonica]|uniref:Transposable element P transposase n=1 Tax=Eumeta variegata TaxID=151549 RepID=A0A4C1YCU9_EUMVA|nr:Transposable element P transposase [Eumeta japonica]
MCVRPATDEHARLWACFGVRRPAVAGAAPRVAVAASSRAARRRCRASDMNNTQPKAAPSCRKYCNVFGCLRNSTTNPELTYFKLPADKERRTQWLQLIERDDLKDRLSNNYCVCEVHFKERDVLVSPNRKLLKKNVLPSLHLPGIRKNEKATQVEILKANNYAQTDNKMSNSITQTAVFISSDDYSKRKLQADSAYHKKNSKTYLEDSVEEPHNRFLYKLCKKFSSKDLTELIKVQTYLRLRYRSNRYTLLYKIFCMKFYYISPRAYQLLEQALCLPCKTSLYKLYIPSSSKIKDDMMTALKVKVGKMSNDEKTCSVIVDLISVKDNLFYDIKKDKIVGFHEVDGVQSPTIAKYALVIFVRGIYIKWKQPIAFILLSKCKNTDLISKWIDKLLTMLLDIGIKIKAFVSDQRLDFLNILENKSVTIDRPYFFIGDTKIHYIFDAPRLMASVCDYLRKYEFHYPDGSIAKYEHIMQFYERDKATSLKLVSKVTEEHVRPSSVTGHGVEVRHAIQVLSKSVAAAITLYADFDAIDESGRDTARFVLMMNDLFDVLNSSAVTHSCKRKRAFCGNDYQKMFLNEILQFFQSLKLIDPENGRDVTHKANFIRGFQITIKSTLRLFDDLQRNGHGYLLTRRLNQDVSRFFFRRISSRNSIVSRVTSWQFMSAFRKLYFSNIIKPPKTDNNKSLMRLLTQFNARKRRRNTRNELSSGHDNEQENKLDEITCSDYNQLLIPAKNYHSYIGAALLKKCAEKHRGCESFQSYITRLNQKTLSFETQFLRRSKWLRLMAREDLMNRNSSHFYVCEKHFDKQDILLTTTRKILKKDIAPSLGLPSPHKDDKETQMEFIEAWKFTQTEKWFWRSDNITQTPIAFYKRKPKPYSYSRKRSKTQKVEMGSEEWEKNQFRELCGQVLSDELAELVKSQRYLKEYYDRGRHTLAYETFCMNLYYASAAGYRLLKEVLCLPCKTALYKPYIPVSTKINDDLLTALKTKVENMSNNEKNCTLVMDIMNLEANLFYQFKVDKIIGFDEIDGIQSPKPAKYALMVIVQGIFVKWMQPIGYALLSEYKNCDEISKWIDKILVRLLNIGLNIRALVTDLRLDFLDIVEKKNTSVERPYFFVNGSKIHIIFDAPHLMQLVCNNFMKYDVQFHDDSVAKLEHIVQFYNKDKTKTLRLAPKLTDKHISPANFEEMEVFFATQLLSRSVATGISSYVSFNVIEKSGNDTAQFVLMMNDLFDVLNSSIHHHSYRYKRAFCGNRNQIDFLNRMLVFIQSLKLIDPENESDDVWDVDFVKGFQITIQSILHLFKDLKHEGYEHLLTRRLSQGISKKMFADIRSKYNSITEPSSKQFVSAFRKKYFSSILDRPKEGNYKGMTKALVCLTDLKVECHSDGINEVSFDRNDNQQLNELQEIVCSDYNQFIFPSKRSFFYICGALLKKCSEKHKDCVTFKSYMKSNQKLPNLGSETRYLRYKNNMYGLLVTPPDDFLNYIQKMDRVFRDVFDQQHLPSKIGHSIYEKIKNISFTPPCPCFPRVYLQKLFVRMRIFVTVLFNNRALSVAEKNIF